MLEIDGSYGEGGGQILRTALALSCITGKRIHIFNIRKGRKKPGLMQQHLTCIKSAKQISDAKTEGAEFGSQELFFSPKKIRGGDFIFNVAEEKGSAGATTLVLQTILPILLFADKPSKVVIKGGTHTNWSPPFHYTEQVLVPTLAQMSINVSLSLKKWGFYPIGKGEIQANIQPVTGIKGVSLVNRGEIKNLRGISVVSGLPRSIAEREKSEAERELKDFTPAIDILEVNAFSKGNFFFLFSETAGFSALGERGKPAETVAQECCKSFLSFYKTNKAIDGHLADQLIIFAALSKEKTVFSTSKISNHLFTNVWVTRKFLDSEISISGESGKPGIVEIN